MFPLCISCTADEVGYTYNKYTTQPHRRVPSFALYAAEAMLAYSVYIEIVGSMCNARFSSLYTTLYVCVLLWTYVSGRNETSVETQTTTRTDEKTYL